MYDVYVKNYKLSNGTINANEILMFSVPSESSLPVSKPIVKSSEDSADSFSFSMDVNSDYYDALLPLKTIFRVEYDGTTIFYGRVMSISTSSVYQTKNVSCEGAFAYLNDTYYEGKQDKNKKKITLLQYLDKIIDNHDSNTTNDKKIQRGILGVTPIYTPDGGSSDSPFLPVDPSSTIVIGDGTGGTHEYHVNDPGAADWFGKGGSLNIEFNEFTGGGGGSLDLPTDKEKYEPSSWSQTISLLNSLTSSYGGHMRVRYANGNLFLDWYKYYIWDYGDNLRPKIAIKKNVLDMSSENNVGDIFTRVIPIGANNSKGNPIYIDGYKYSGNTKYSGKAMPVSFIRNLYSDAELTDEFHNAADYRDAEANYGVIYKTVDFTDVDKQSKLWNLTKKWIKDCYFGLITSFTVKAIDMHILSSGNFKILLGECVDVTYTDKRGSLVTKKLVCKSVQYDLFNPDNNSYTLGIPSDLLDRNRKKSSKKTSSEQNAENTPSHSTPTGSDPVWTFYKVYQRIGTLDDDHRFNGTVAAENFYSNGEMNSKDSFYDPFEENDDGQIGDQASQDSSKWFGGTTIGKIKLPGAGPKWVAYSEDRGIFAYQHTHKPNPVMYWYYQGKCSYQFTTSAGSGSGSSTFEDIAKIIEADDDSTYGGTANANSFRSYGRQNATVQYYDPEDTSDPRNNPQYVHTAQVVGKFKVGNVPLRWVAVNGGEGVFAYQNISQDGTQPVKHWYKKGSGTNYEQPSNTTTNEDGSTTTSLPNANGDQTIIFEPGASTGQGSQGRAWFGYDTTQQGDKWRIKLNAPIKYKDKDGHEQTVDGFVSASDFNVAEIPSFKTAIGIFDVVIAGVVFATDIQSEMAYIKKLKSDTIHANVGVSAGRINCTNITASNYYLPVSSSSDSGSDRASLNNCFSNCLVYVGQGRQGVDYDVKGHIYFQFNKIGGGIAQVVNFNIADTQAYKDAVSAAQKTGWTQARSVIVQSLPKSNTAIALNTNYTLKIPKEEYNSGGDEYVISVTDLMKYQPPNVSTKIDVVQVLLNNFVVYTKEIPINDIRNQALKDGWTAARSIIINSMPKSDYTGVDQSSYVIRVPVPNYTASTNINYNSNGWTISLGNPEDYQPSGVSTKIKTIDVKLGGYTVCKKELKLQAVGPITPTEQQQTFTPGTDFIGFKPFIVNSGSSLVTKGWNAARDKILKSFPDGDTQPINTNSNWTLKVPAYNGYGSTMQDYILSVSGLTSYQPQGVSTKVKVYNVKIGDYVAYRKEVKLASVTADITNEKHDISVPKNYDAISSVSVPAISIAIDGSVTRQSTVPTGSGWSHFVALKTAVKSAINNNTNKVVILKFKVNGATGVTQKYYLDFNE